jgi:hypothetical protein
MKQHGSLILRALLLLFMGWLYGGDVIRWVQAQSAEVTALAELPRLWLGLLGTAVTIGGVVVLVQSRTRPPTWKGLRLLTIAALSVLFLDFVVLNSRRTPLTTNEQAAMAVQFVAESAEQQSGTKVVLRDPNALHEIAAQLGEVPYFVKGERVPSWKVELRERCSGPADDAGSAEVGTLIYCVANDRALAWVTLVGTPFGQVFGPRGVVSTKGVWVGEVHLAPAPPPEEDPDADPDLDFGGPPQDPPVWGGPTQDEP